VEINNLESAPAQPLHSGETKLRVNGNAQGFINICGLQFEQAIESTRLEQSSIFWQGEELVEG
jgi:hypothetical protein